MVRISRAVQPCFVSRPQGPFELMMLPFALFIHGEAFENLSTTPHLETTKKMLNSALAAAAVLRKEKDQTQ